MPVGSRPGFMPFVVLTVGNLSLPAGDRQVKSNKILSFQVDASAGVITLDRGGAPMPKFTTVAIAAKRLGVHYETLRKWLVKGIVPGRRAGSRGHWMVNLAEVREAMKFRGKDEK